MTGQPDVSLYLVRHGRTAYNREGRVQGRRIDAPLDALGRAQAARLAERFADVPLAAVYTSVLRRTAETAAPLLARRPDLRATALADLDEMSWGALEGQPASERLTALYHAMNARWRAGETDARVPGGESPEEVATRALHAVRAIQERHAGASVLVVTHGRLLRVLLCALLHEGDLSRMQDFPTPNAALTHVVLSETHARLERLADTAHLAGLDEPVLP